MKPTVLSIEDNEQNQYLVTFLLERHGYRVVPAGNGRQGIELAQTLVPYLILLEIQLPCMDGHEVAGILRGHFARSRPAGQRADRGGHFPRDGRRPRESAGRGVHRVS